MTTSSIGMLFPGFLHPFSNDSGHGGTTGDFHIDDRYASDVGGAENFGKLVYVLLGIVEFGTAEEDRFPFHEFAVKIRDMQPARSRTRPTGRLL